MAGLADVRDLLVAPFYEGDSWGSLDLALDPLDPRPGDSVDVAVASGANALRQGLLLRLLTPLGSLDALGHPDFGSRLHELIGEVNTPTTRALARSYVLRAVRADSRVDEILSLEVAEPDQLSQDRLSITLLVQPADSSDPVALGIEVTL